MKAKGADWFKPSKYEDFRKIALHQWYWQLYIRQALYNHFYHGWNASHVSVYFCAEHIKVNPELSFDLSVAIWIKSIKSVPVLPDSKYIKFTSDIKKPTVYPLSIERMYTLSLDTGIDDVWKECCDKWNTLELDDDSDAYKDVDEVRYNACKNQCENDEAFFHLSVDLYATDEQIVNDFEFWLVEARKKYNRKPAQESPDPKRTKKKKNFSDKDMGIWVNDRIIQYLDLKIISAFEEKKITNEGLGEILFPDISGDKVRRTVKDKALLLISDEMMKAFASQLGI